MNYRRCQCGKCESWESGMHPQDCEGCRECGTTFASHPDGHKPIQPHVLDLRYSDKTGEPSHFICKKCRQRVPLDEGQKEELQ